MYPEYTPAQRAEAAAEHMNNMLQKASRFKILYKVTLPIVLPALVSTVLLV